MAVKKHDYIEVSYTGKLKDEEIVFDTTDQKVAKEHGLFDAKMTYKPIIVCIGKRQLIKGLDDQIIGKEPGKHTFHVKDVDAFGKKDPKLLRLMPMSLFHKEQVKPFPGLEVNIDNMYGIVKSVSGGRVIVDFNHPLSSKDLVYEVEIKRVLIDQAEKLRGMLDLLKFDYSSATVEDDKAVITTAEKIPEPITDVLIKDIVETIGVKSVEFRTKEETPAEKKEGKGEEKKAWLSKEEDHAGHDHAGHDHHHE